VLVSANHDERSLTVIELATARVVGNVALNDPAQSVALTADGTTALSTAAGPESRAVLVTDLQSLRTSGEIAVESQPYGIVAIPGTGLFAVTNRASNSVSIVDQAVSAARGSIAVGSEPTGLIARMLNGATRLFVANAGDGTVSIVDPTGMRVEGSVAVGGHPTRLAATADGSELFALRPDDATVVVIDPRAGLVKSSISVGVNPTDLAASPTGRYLYVSASDQNRNLWKVDLASLTPVANYNLAGSASGTAVSFGGDSNRLFLTTADGKVVYFDTTQERQTSSANTGRGPSGLAIGLFRGAGQ